MPIEFRGDGFSDDDLADAAEMIAAAEARLPLLSPRESARLLAIAEAAVEHRQHNQRACADHPPTCPPAPTATSPPLNGRHPDDVL